MPNTLRAGVIGLGRHGHEPRPRLRRDARRRAGRRRRHRCRARRAGGAIAAGARGFDDYRRMLDEERLDLVTVAVPTRMHFDVAAACHRARHAAARREAAGGDASPRASGCATSRPRRGVPMTVGHIERFNPAVIELKRRARGGRAGARVPGARAARRAVPRARARRRRRARPGAARHRRDALPARREVARVQAETEQRINTEHEDMLSGLLRFTNGVVGVLDVNWLTPTKIRELSVLGERGMFVVDYLARELTFFENAHPRGQGGRLGGAPPEGRERGAGALARSREARAAARRAGGVRRRRARRHAAGRHRRTTASPRWPRPRRWYARPAPAST